jgi:hypothetical protein
LLKRLQTLGYIKRRRDPADKRQVRVRLTERGRTLRAKALHIPGCILAASGLDARTAKQPMTGDCDISTYDRKLKSKVIDIRYHPCSHGRVF